MKIQNTQVWRWLPAALLLAVGGILTVRANGFAIQSFDGTGRLTFNEINGAETYRVEWAPAPGGPWTNTWDALAEITAHGSGIVTCSVPMCYRVVAVFPPPPPGMVLIPGGTNAGTNPDVDVGAYTLTVSHFYMDKFEVSKTQWDEVYLWAITKGYSFDNVGSGKATDHPVHTVNWFDVVKWCNARSEKEGRSAVYTIGVNGAVYKVGQEWNNVIQSAAAGYRLPTVVEWEYAARGGVANQRFSWGDTNTIQHARANYYGSSSTITYDSESGMHPTYATGNAPFTSPVGKFAPNGYGLYDMTGNVSEWCFEWYLGQEGSRRVVCGGSWTDNAYYCRVGFPFMGPSDYPRNSAGFRAVLPLGQQ